MDDKKPGMADIKVQVVGAAALIVAMFAGMIFLTDSPSLDRCPGARAEDQVPPRLADARYAHAPGLPRPEVVGIRTPVASVISPPPHPDEKLLTAIRAKEAWDCLMEPNVDGEYGAYQVTYDWYLDACRGAGVVPDSPGWEWPTIAYHPHKIPFLMHYYWLLHLGPDASDYRKACAHNGGPEDGQDLRAHAYAREVLNIKMTMGGE